MRSAAPGPLCGPRVEYLHPPSGPPLVQRNGRRKWNGKRKRNGSRKAPYNASLYSEWLLLPDAEPNERRTPNACRTPGERPYKSEEFVLVPSNRCSNYDRSPTPAWRAYPWPVTKPGRRSEGFKGRGGRQTWLVSGEGAFHRGGASWVYVAGCVDKPVDFALISGVESAVFNGWTDRAESLGG